MKFPGVVAVVCVIPSGLVLHIGISSCNFPPWTEMSKKNDYETMKHLCRFFLHLVGVLESGPPSFFLFRHVDLLT